MMSAVLPFRPAKIRIAGLMVVALCVVFALSISFHWPLVGDEALMHYVVYLVRHGWVPYRQIKDINLPGTYFVEAVFMRLLGGGNIAWRVYDSILLAGTISAYFAICGRTRWFAAVMASGLFVLIHLQDGIIEVGQRDLLMAALLLWCCYWLERADKSGSSTKAYAAAGALLGVSLQIKPILILLVLIVPLAIWRRNVRRGRASCTAELTAFLLALLAPALLAVWWLHHIHALRVFVQQTIPLLRLHDELGRKTFEFLLFHALTPLGPLLAVWILLIVCGRSVQVGRRGWLVAALFAALAGYFMQGKGFTYQRYPQIAVALLILCLDFNGALDRKGWAGMIGLACVLLGCGVLPIRFARLTSSYSGKNEFQSALERDIAHVGSASALSGNIQCLDTYSGCIATLYSMRLQQATGYLYDCYLYENNSIIADRYRAGFWRDYLRTRPRVIVVTDQLCFRGGDGFSKVDRWPLMAHALNTDYTMNVEWHSSTKQHFWKRYEQPAAFRIYVRRVR